MKKKHIVVLAVLLILTILFSCSRQDSFSDGRDNGLENIDDIVVAMGDYVKDNRQLFLSAIDYKSDVANKEIAFWVDGLPVTKDEINFRLGLSAVSGSGSRTMEEMKKVFIEYRVIEKEAIELNLLPTDDEIEERIYEKMLECSTDSLARDIKEKVMEAWDLTEEEYWDVERYEAYYFLMCEKVGQHYPVEKAWAKFIEEKTKSAIITWGN